MAHHFKVDGDPHNYPIHMKGKTVLKLDTSARPVLTPKPKTKNLQSDAAALIKVQGQIVHAMETKPYVDLNKLSAAARSVGGVLMKKNAILCFCKPSTD